MLLALYPYRGICHWLPRFRMPGSEALMQPSDMTDAELDAALSRLALLHRDAPATRRQVVGRVCDRVLDEVLTRRENAAV